MLNCVPLPTGSYKTCVQIAIYNLKAKGILLLFGLLLLLSFKKQGLLGRNWLWWWWSLLWLGCHFKNKGLQIFTRSGFMAMTWDCGSWLQVYNQFLTHLSDLILEGNWPAWLSDYEQSPISSFQSPIKIWSVLLPITGVWAVSHQQGWVTSTEIVSLKYMIKYTHCT